MKKFLVLALLLAPAVSFAAPSVRVLGSGSGTTASSATGSKITPAKTASVSKTAATNAANAGRTASGSRIGTVRATPKVANTVANTTASGTASRFPVITPAHSYSSVTKPQTAGGNTTVNVDLDNYYNKEEVNNIINALKQEDDPRFDMIRVSHGNPQDNWNGYQIPEGYVFMWIEEE
ncbi:MAG: hypothetical protein IJQ55_01690, partial [Alphaproteobacteria bacterium]|nr:hypothetical protein [Alphaproteobacteria bacterium]